MLEWFDSTAALYNAPVLFILLVTCERDGMVDMSGLDSDDFGRVGSSPAARIRFEEFTLAKFFLKFRHI